MRDDKHDTNPQQMRILIGQLSQETNCFNPIPTEHSAFVVVEPEDIVEHFAPTGSVIGGIVTACRDEGLVPVPTVAAASASGGPVADEAFEAFSSRIVHTATQEQPDLVALDLHGAMMTQSFDDPEGVLLQRLREVVGDDVLIGVGLDLHAHLTDRMIEAADIIVPCKKNPHSDLRETGMEVVDLLLRCHKAGQKPRKIHLRIPMLLQGNTETHTGPLRDAHHRLAQWKQSQSTALDASLCNCQPFLDADDMGQVLLFSELGHSGTAQACANAVARELWDRRDEFFNAFPSLEDALQIVRAEVSSRPFVISDYGDRTNAGAPGDSPVALQLLTERFGDLKVAVPITDPWAVEAAERAGPGGDVSLKVGARFTPGLFEPFTFSGKVKHLSDGIYRIKGPMLAGQIARNGRTAVLECGNLTVVATSRPARTQDTNFYESLGLRIAEFDAVIVKSGNHFQLSYDGIATAIKADTPGVGAYRAGQMPPLRRAPVYPEADAPLFAPSSAIPEFAS